MQLTDTTTIKYPNTGRDLLSGWKIFCNDKNTNGKTTNFIISKKKQTVRRAMQEQLAYLRSAIALCI